MPDFYITVGITENCNLRCKYCYVDKDKSCGSISDEVLLATIEQVKKKVDEGFTVHIDVFGGEPLTEKIKVKFFIRHIAEIGEKYIKRVHVSVFTNGTLVDDDIVQFIKGYKGLATLSFSVDGCKDCHNVSRPYADGSGSYDDTMRGLELYCREFGIQPEYVMGKFTISPDNIDYFVQTLREYAEQGRPNVYTNWDRDAVWTDEALARYKKAMYEGADFYIANFGKLLHVTHFIYPILDYEYSSESYCGAGISRWGVSPDGNIYPCQRFQNNRSPFVMGNVFDGVSGKWNAIFSNITAKCIRACNICDTFTRRNCLGQCIAACYEDSGDLFKAIGGVCQMIKITYNVARYIQSKLAGNSQYDSLFTRRNGG